MGENNNLRQEITHRAPNVGGEYRGDYEIEHKQNRGRDQEEHGEQNRGH